MGDYPDWTRLFYLVGTTITIPINIESSDITLDVNLTGSDIQLDVNIAAAAVSLDINFLDQSVAVFDANQWFALQALQIFVHGGAAATTGTLTVIASRTVPPARTFFIAGAGFGVLTAVSPVSCYMKILVDSVESVTLGAETGGGWAFDTPIRATAGQLVEVAAVQQTGAQKTIYGGCWGYDRED